MVGSGRGMGTDIGADRTGAEGMVTVGAGRAAGAGLNEGEGEGLVASASDGEDLLTGGALGVNVGRGALGAGLPGVPTRGVDGVATPGLKG